MKNAIRVKLPHKKYPNKEYPKTRIMATVGRKSMGYENLRAMVEEGVTFFRLNGAHILDKPEDNELSYDDVKEIARNIRRLRSEFRQLIGIYFDLGGPKIRVKSILGVETRGRDNCLHPKKGDRVIIYRNDPVVEKTFNSLFGPKPKPNWEEKKEVRQYFETSGKGNGYELVLDGDPFSLSDFTESKLINMKDGWCQLKIDSFERDAQGERLICKVEYVDLNFKFLSKQGANPYRYKFFDVITEKDKKDIKEALKIGADVISLSFVCSEVNGNELRRAIENLKKEIPIEDQSDLYRRYIENHEIPIFAKIETAYAVLQDEAKDYEQWRYSSHHGKKFDPLSRIAHKFDGLMVARGDLALEVEKYKVPYWQKLIIEKAHLNNKPVIVATEMLNSMKAGKTSTRAEIQDINTAVHQEADILMLAGETASSDKPADVVKEMRKAILQAERERESADRKKIFENIQKEREKELEKESRNYYFLSREIFSTKARLAQGSQVCVSANSLGSEAIITSVQTGNSVKEIAYFRPWQKIFAITDDTLTAVRLLQHRGVYPVVMERPLKRTLDEFVDIANEIHVQLKIPIPDRRNDDTTFKIPGLVLITPEFTDGFGSEENIPNSIHVFTLPIEPEPRRENERKYILLENGYKILRDALKEDAIDCKYLKQYNYYLTDMNEILFRQEILLRVRVEEELKEKKSSLEISATERTNHRKNNIYFTLKGKETTNTKSGARERKEIEYDISQEVGNYYKEVGIKDEPNIKLSFAKFKFLESSKELQYFTFYRNIIWKLYESSLKEKYNNSDDVSYKMIARSINKRYRFEMPNGLILELDETTFNKGGKDYQLEVEFRDDERLIKLLNEYIQDKMGRLRIPCVCVDTEEIKYPSKVLMAYFFAGLKKGDIKAIIDQVKDKLVAQQAQTNES